MKDREIYEKLNILHKKLEDYENNVIQLDNMELYQLNSKIDDLYIENETEFHDCFRTNKRNEDDTYSNDVIYSLHDTIEWLKNNPHSELDNIRIEEFWNKYPNGVIDFG